MPTLIKVVVKQIYQKINDDIKQSLQEELSALKAELALLTGSQPKAYAYLTA